jgi:SulP family sulfate permease
MVGALQLVMGLARMGMLVNFVSHSVIVGFATGAGILIAVRQLVPLLGISVESDNVLGILKEVVLHMPELHPATAVIGFGVMIAMVIIRRINPRLPNALISMVGASVVVALFSLQDNGVAVIGELEAGLPPLADLPVLT